MVSRFAPVLLMLAMATSFSCGSSSAGPNTPPAVPRVVKIVQMDGGFDAEETQPMDVHQGAMVSLAVDLFKKVGDKLEPETTPVTDFVWASDLSEDDVCYADKSDDCLKGTSFQVTDYGINFYMPEKAPQEITITVWSTKVEGAADSIVLRNLDYVEPAETPPSNPEN